MKKKRFYKNKKRNQKWTEPAAGRQIDFADKYVGGGIYSDKFDFLRPKPKKKKRRPSAETALKIARGFGAVLFSIAFIFTGYTLMDIYMLRHRMPALSQAESNGAEMQLSGKSGYLETACLDGGDKLISAIEQLAAGGCTSAVIDIKRPDGSVAYQSGLSSVRTFGAVSSPAGDLAESAAVLGRYGILALGRVYCYSDNIAPEQNRAMAVLNQDGTLYRDSAGNTYLNPESDEAYSYIKDIIAECCGAGITVFVLDGLQLPTGTDSGGFDALSKRLYSDLGTEIQLLDAQRITAASG